MQIDFRCLVHKVHSWLSGNMKHCPQIGLPLKKNLWSLYEEIYGIIHVLTWVYQMSCFYFIFCKVLNCAKKALLVLIRFLPLSTAFETSLIGLTHEERPAVLVLYGE